MRLATVLVLLALAPVARAEVVAELRDAPVVRTAGGAVYYEVLHENGDTWIHEAGPGRAPVPVTRLVAAGEGTCEPSDIASCLGVDVHWEVSSQRVAIRKQAEVAVKGAFIEPNGSSFDWGPLTGPLERIEECNGSPYFPRFSLDGDTIAYRDNCEGFEPRVRTGTDVWTVPYDSGEPVDLAGDWVAVDNGGYAPSEVAVFDHATRAATPAYTVALEGGSATGVTREGELVVARTKDDPACAVETTWYSVGEPVPHLLGCGVNAPYVAGGRALLHTAPGVFSVTDVPGTPTPALTAEPYTLASLDFDGQRVAYARASCRGYEIAIFDVATPETYAPGPNPCGASFRTRRARLRGRRVFIRVRCREACRGNVVVTGVGSSGPVSIRAGRTRRIGVSVRRKARRALRRGERIRADVTFVQGLQPATSRVTLRPPRRR